MSKQGYIQRYLLIIRLIRNNRYISLPELIRKVEDGLGRCEEWVDKQIKSVLILVYTNYHQNLQDPIKNNFEFDIVTINSTTRIIPFFIWINALTSL